MAKDVQISAPVSRATKELLERQVKATGVKKGHLIESALRFHLRALYELPADVIVPPRLVLTGKSFAAAAARLEKPGRPPRALVDLMQDGD